jgi:hypothetical protein
VNAIPVENAIPVSVNAFAALAGGITSESVTPEPAVGVPAVLWNATFRAAALEL